MGMTDALKFGDDVETRTVLMGRGVPVYGNTDIDIFTDNPAWTGDLGEFIQDLAGYAISIHTARGFKEHTGPVADNFRFFHRDRTGTPYPRLFRYEISIALEEITDPAVLADFWRENE